MGATGKGHRHRRRVIDGDTRNCIDYLEDPHALHSLSKQVRPALAEPDQLTSGNRCLTIEARARGLHAGPSAWHSPVAD